ncbi:YwqJ-related putative deaminase [Clostridium sporogenes]|uniref:YwqJ-related putative deaminase n=1 Tax=Clostridium sporogenes TaxID=1509 RepID=UPI000AC1D439|nr:YwqJ-related putative deaminase [Clostridium sporogenes]
MEYVLEMYRLRRLGRDFFGFLDKSFNNIIDGVLKGLTDLVVGLAQLAIGAVEYVGSCAVVVLWEPFGGAPDWAKNKVNEDNELISSILKDPALIVEGISQYASDAIDEKGICYSVGYLGGTFLGTKGLDKITKGVKGLISGGKAATINSLDDIARYGLNSLDDIIEKAGIQSVDDLTRIGVTSAEDLSKLGVNSVDDLAKLGINNIDELSKLGISSEELSKAGIKGISNPELSRIDYLRNKYGKLTSEQINNRINLRGAVNDELERLYKSGISKKELGPAVAGVLDSETGKYYFGINNIEGDVPKELHPLIKERIDNMPKNILDSYSNRTLGAGSHAEVYALNEALLSNPNAKLDNFMVYVVRSGKKLKPKGLPMPRCPHCEFITDGANYFPEVLKYGN